MNSSTLGKGSTGCTKGHTEGPQEPLLPDSCEQRAPHPGRYAQPEPRSPGDAQEKTLPHCSGRGVSKGAHPRIDEQETQG